MILFLLLLIPAVAFGHDIDSGYTNNYYYYGGGVDGNNVNPQQNLIEGPTGKPGKMGPPGVPGPVGPQGETGERGADGECQCDVSELNRVSQQLEIMQRQIEALQCEEGKLRLGDLCYVFVKNNRIRSVSSAEEKCQALGGTLVHLKTRAVYEKVKDYIEEVREGKHTQVWLGGGYTYPGKEVTWSDGTTTTPDYWFGTPERYSSSTAMFLLTGGGKEGLFNDSPTRNYLSLYLLCQIPM